MPTEFSPVTAHDKQELRQLIKEAHLAHGSACDLNHIDVSKITDFSYLFSDMHFESDISRWDTSAATDMTAMFRNSHWHGSIADWDVSRVLVMDEMFRRAAFEGDLSRWNVSSVKSMAQMFSQSIFDGDISKWDVSQVTNMRAMFDSSFFSGDISGWNVRRVQNMDELFVRADYPGDLSPWRPESLVQAQTMLTRHTMREMPGKCFYHWYSAIVENRVFDPDVLAFVHQHKPTMDALGMTPLAASLALQDHWLARGQTPEAPVDLPDLGLDNV